MDSAISLCDNAWREVTAVLSSVLRSKIDALWNKLYANGLSNPLTAIDQLSYLLFIKRLDEEDRTRQQAARFRNERYTSLFAGRDELRWSEFCHLDPEAMLPHVRDKVFPFIKSLGGKDEPYARHMKDAVFLLPTPALLDGAIKSIDEIYEEIERERRDGGHTFHDLQGDVYEYLLSELSTSGKNGQFRTPRHIIAMICALVDPDLRDEICDPACGTGGFLVGAYQHILCKHTSAAERWTDESGIERGLLGDQIADESAWQRLRERTFYGFDIDPIMVRIGLMNLMLHGIERPNLEHAATLSKHFKEEARYDIVLANPPFKGSLDASSVDPGLGLSTRKTELLFVSRIMKLLRNGGRAGVIVPDGVLFGSSKAHADLRKQLIATCELEAVVSMPSGVFKPYAGVSTAVLVFTKAGKTEQVWFYDMTADGFSLDDKRQKVAENDIPDILRRWKSRDPEKDTDRTAKAFFVPLDEIKANSFDLSINRYKQVVHEELKYEPPKALIKRLRELEAAISKELGELEGML